MEKMIPSKQSFIPYYIWTETRGIQLLKHPFQSTLPSQLLGPGSREDGRSAEPMKDHSLDGHRGKVAPEVGGTTNFDDDYNEWELGIGDLIIDLDADIEKTTVERQQQASLAPMSKRAVEHQATVDKGLKMKIKRKNVGGKASETKHEIVQSDTTKSCLLPEPVSTPVAPTTTPLPPQATDTSKSSKHSSGKGRSGSHREKKEKNREKTSSAASKPAIVNSSISAGASSPTVPEVNGVSPPPALKISPPPGPSLGPFSVPSPGPQVPPDMPNLTLRLPEEPPSPTSPPPKRIKLEKVDAACSTATLEVKDMGTDTSSVGTITEPDCLGPCEPGTSVTLEGIVWQETQGGVLVVNVTWRGKTYVGTLLDCTKHDWAPPRFCESPTSDVDSKNAKGRGKRGRTNNTSENNTFTENRPPVQSKLRNGKGRRGFTVPSSPAKADTSSNSSGTSSKRKGSKPSESSEPAPEPKSSSSSSSSSSGGGSGNCKRARSQSKGPAASSSSTPSTTTTSVTTTTTTTTATTTAAPCSSTPSPTPPDCDQAPASPVFIECPEPNCSKKYKHINGLKYHQTHAHSGNPGEIKMEEGSLEEVGKEPSDAEEGLPPSPSLPSSDWVPTVPESDNLSTLASVAISDSAKPTLRTFPPPPPVSLAEQDIPAPCSPTSPNIFSQAAAAGPRCSNPPHLVDKGKIKQEKVVPKPSSKPPYLSTPVRAIVPAPSQAQQSLKPIQPKPTILGEPPCINPALESLKREKSKHRKKNKERKSSEKGSLLPASSSVSEDKMESSYMGGGPDVLPNMSEAVPLDSSPLELTPPAVGGLLGEGGIISENVQSPAYSDISDANEPPATLDNDLADKDKVDKKTTELTPSQTSALTTFGMYSYYGQPPYLIPSVTSSPADKAEKPLDATPSSKTWNELDSVAKKSSQEETSATITTPTTTSSSSSSSANLRDFQHHYPFPYSYVQGFPYSVDAPYHLHQYEQYLDDPERVFKGHSSGKGGLEKEEKSSAKERSGDKHSSHSVDSSCKQAVSVIKEPEGLLSQGNSSSKSKMGVVSREKQLENHQIIKENMELKSQMGKMKHYDMSRLLESRHQPPEDLKRFYILHEQEGGSKGGDVPDQRVMSPPKLDHPKNYSSSSSTSSPKGHHHHHSSSKKDLPPPPIVKSEDLSREERKSDKFKSEGQKPTMETTGPPPPPTNSYAYLPPSYLQSPPSHFAHMPFDHGAHPMYRNMMMSPSHHAFSGSPFIHPTLRYPSASQAAGGGDSKLHPSAPTKALDLLHQVSQHYTSSSSNHKIHELQEHAIAGPSSNKGGSSAVPPSVGPTDPSSAPATPGKQQESRSSPPPQRHLHTHHHTHVGVTYPLYDPYGAMIVTQQAAAAAASVIPFNSK